MNNCIPCETPKTPLEAARLMQHHLNNVIADLDTLNRMDKIGLTSAGFEAVRDNVTERMASNAMHLTGAYKTLADLYNKEVYAKEDYKPFTTNIPV